MRNTLRQVSISAAALALCLGAVTLALGDDGDFNPLFNGKDLSGWVTPGDQNMGRKPGNRSGGMMGDDRTGSGATTMRRGARAVAPAGPLIALVLRVEHDFHAVAAEQAPLAILGIRCALRDLEAEHIAVEAQRCTHVEHLDQRTEAFELDFHTNPVSIGLTRRKHTPAGRMT